MIFTPKFGVVDWRDCYESHDLPYRLYWLGEAPNPNVDATDEAAF
jgi:hypothetical protein